MADTQDEQIRREVWTGSVPVAFSLATNEITSLTAPDPLFLLVPRCSYFPLFAEQLREQFLKSSPPRIDAVWLEFGGRPLKWHLPIGVLFDLWGTPQGSDGETSAWLPWSITVHFQEFPSQVLVKYQTGSEEAAIQASFMNNLKEANHLKHGDGSKMNMLSQKEQTDLWEGVRNSKFETFWKANEILTPEAPKDYEHVPIRLCRRDKPILQEPVSALDKNGNARTLGDALIQLVPEFAGVSPDKTNSRVLVHGVSPPMDTPLTWLASNCTYADNFVYVILLR